MAKTSYKLRPAKPGSGIPSYWRTRAEDGNGVEGAMVTTDQAAAFDLDAYFPPGHPYRDWFEPVEDTPADVPPAKPDEAPPPAAPARAAKAKGGVRASPAQPESGE